VKILDEGEGALTINGASIFYVKEDAVKEVQWPSSLIGTSRDSNQRTTIVTIDMRTPGIPTHRLTVTIPEVNFHRDVRIQTSNNHKEWRTILSNSQIYAYDTAKFAGSSLSITYPETTDRYLRLVISDLDSPPLTVQGVGVWGIWRRVVFAAEERRTYRLFYGNPHASRPSYDIERIFPYLETESLTQAQLGHQKVNPDYIEKTPPLPPFTERMPWLLPIVITVATILIAFILFKVVRQARNMLPPPSE
jgi:hypothetical protein